jgi:hypothetical protein
MYEPAESSSEKNIKTSLPGISNTLGNTKNVKEQPKNLHWDWSGDRDKYLPKEKKLRQGPEIVSSLYLWRAVWKIHISFLPVYYSGAQRNPAFQV